MLKNMNADLLLDVCRFLMREHLERLELVCFHWQRLIALATAEWGHQLPLRPVQSLEIVLNGVRSTLEMEEYCSQYKGVDHSYYTWRSGDIDLRYHEQQSMRQAQRVLVFPNDPVDFFRQNNAIWRGCYVRYMHLHITDSMTLTLLISALKNKKKQAMEDMTLIADQPHDEGRRQIKRISTNFVEVLCFHIASNCLLIDNRKRQMEEETMIHAPTLSEMQLIIAEFAMTLIPDVYCIYAPIFNGHNELFAGLIPLFPTICRHIDLQMGNCCSLNGRDYIDKQKTTKQEEEEEGQSTLLDTSLQETLLMLIFSDKINTFEGQKNKFYQQKQQQQQQWRMIWKQMHDKNGECTNVGCCEHALSSLTLHPLRVNAEFIAEITEQFVTLISTEHLVGRRIHLYIGAQLNSFADTKMDNDGNHPLFGDWCQDNIDEQLHSAWKAWLDNPKNLHRRQQINIRLAPFDGEYLALNTHTGLEMCIQFNSHRWKCDEFHNLNERKRNAGKNDDKLPYIKYPCPYTNCFVLELSTA